MLSNSKNELQNKINKILNNEYYKKVMNIKINKLRNKLIIYFIVEFILDLFFSYYVTAFCAVYRNSQKYWFYGCLESFGFDILFSIISCIVLSLLRYVSIRKRNECLYKTANIISIIL